MTKIRNAKNNKSFFKIMVSKLSSNLSKIGKSLLFPIATLPIAAILLRIGSQLPGGTPFGDVVSSIISSGGKVLFQNLHIVFAIGVAFGLTKDNRGEAAMAGFIGVALMTVLLSSKGVDLSTSIYKNINLEPAPFASSGSEGFHAIFTTTKNDAYDAILSENVLNGIIAGLIVSFIYNKFNGTELPSLLGFFSGRRLIPVLTILSILFFGVLYSIVFPWIGYGLYKFSESLSGAMGNRYANASIMGIYGLVNRLLIPIGLHHIPNTLFWFTLPVLDTENHQIITDATNNPVSGDIFAFLNGVAKNNPSGTFQSGFFPIMMFGLPALALVFYKNAEGNAQKRRVLSIFGSAAVVSFLTGITEPLEFAFMFVSPMLFLLHALLTGLFGFITGLFGIQLGFGFSAGFLDYALSIPKSMDIIHANKVGISAVLANPGWIFAIGAVSFSTYFFLPNFLIKKFNIETPGRGKNLIESSYKAKNINQNNGELSLKGKMIVKGLGGWDNITNYQNCTTRIRYDVKKTEIIDERLLKKAGAIGFMKISDTHVQVIIGPEVEILNNEIKSHIGDSLFIDNQKSKNIEKLIEVKSIISGKAIELSSLTDGVFSKKMLGDGLVIEFNKDCPDKVVIKAPISGKIVTAFDTSHAFGIRKDDGTEILIHIGIDSVVLKGNYFKPFVKMDDLVNVGDALVEVNVKNLRSKIKDFNPIIINTSGDKVIFKKNGKVKELETIFKIKKDIEKDN